MTKSSLTLVDLSDQTLENIKLTYSNSNSEIVWEEIMIKKHNCCRLDFESRIQEKLKQLELILQL